MKRNIELRNEVNEYFKTLAMNHCLVRHDESHPHYCCLNDEKEMLLSAQMNYPFVFFAFGGSEISDDELHETWGILLSVQTHVGDTGNHAEVNKASNLCLSILDDFLVRATSREAKDEHPWLRGLDLSGSQKTAIENESDALWGWMVECRLTLPWCRRVEDWKWEDLKHLDV